jgi:hypothetical protein
MKFLYFVVFLLSFANCFATQENKRANKNKSHSSSLEEDYSHRVAIPQNVLLLDDYKDKDSVEYQVLVFKASIDTVNAGKNALEGLDSAGALKVLSYGLTKIPFRDDIRELRNKALVTYIDITKKLEENIIKNCNALIERYTFLDTVAPDGLLQLKNDRSCIKKLQKIENEQKKEKIYSLLEIPAPKIQKKLEQNYKSDLSKSVEYYVLKNNNFPGEDLLINIFMKFLAIYGHQPIAECGKFTADPDSVDVNDLNVNSNCNIKINPVANLNDVFKLYQENLYEFFFVQNGKVSISNIKTSKPLKSLYDCIINGVDDEGERCWLGDDRRVYGIHKGLPNCVIMNMNMVYKDKTESFPFVSFFYHQSDPTKTKFGPRFRKLNFSEQSLDNDIKDCIFPEDRSFASSNPGGTEGYINVLANEYAFKKRYVFKGLNSNQIRGLQNITFNIDFNKTYHIYKDSLFKSKQTSILERQRPVYFKRTYIQIP